MQILKRLYPGDDPPAVYYYNILSIKQRSRRKSDDTESLIQ